MLGSHQKTLACGVDAELYAQYRASLPVVDGEPMTMNAHLRSLVEAWLDGSMYPERWITSTPGVVDPPPGFAWNEEIGGWVELPIYDPARPIGEQTNDAPALQAFVDAVAEDPAGRWPILVHERTGPGEPNPGCMHPHRALTRAGHIVICSDCGRIVPNR